MIALDTNVVVRLLVEDDAAQTAAAVRLVRRAREEGARLFIADVVVCETAWVLRSCYRKSRDEVSAALDVLAAVEQAEFEAPDRLAAALESFRSGSGDLADYLIREHGRRVGAAFVATFDKTLHEEPGFVPPDPRAWGAGTSIREARPPDGRRGRRAVRAAT